MTQRENYRRFIQGLPGANVPNLDNGPLMSTYERWLAEGLNPALDPRRYDEWCDAFGLDRYPLRLAYHEPGPEPLFAEDILEETQTTITKRRADGSIFQDNKGYHKTIPREIRPAITCRAEWDRMKEWMDLDRPLPSPADSPALAGLWDRARQSAQPVWLDAGSLVGVVRNLLGFEAFVMMAYDDPAWIEDMIEFQCLISERQVRLFGENHVPVDVVHFWEDICFKNGPMMNPAHFRELAVPRYRRLADLAASYGCRTISVDSDGNIWALLEAWMDGGVNLFWPLEVQAGMDVNELQTRLAGRAVWMGGIHKGRLAHGPAAIRDELLRTRPALAKGCYLPTLDHCCPPDVSFDNYLTYLRLRHEILGLGQAPPDESRLRAK